MDNFSLANWRDPTIAPRMAAGVEALISALPASWNSAHKVIIDTGLAESTARDVIRKALNAGYLTGTGTHVKTVTTRTDGSRKTRYTDTRVLSYVDWPKNH
jgi:hypothetical protein